MGSMVTSHFHSFSGPDLYLGCELWSWLVVALSLCNKKTRLHSLTGHLSFAEATQQNIIDISRSDTINRI